MKRIIPAILFLLSVSVYPYGTRPELVSADSVWMLSLQEKYEDVDSVFADAVWTFRTTGIMPEVPMKYARKGGEVVFSRYDRRKFERIQGEFENPLFNRMAQLMYLRMLKFRNRFIPHHNDLESSIMLKLISHR